MKWEKAWAYLTCSHVVLVVSVRLQLSCSAPVLGELLYTNTAWTSYRLVVMVVTVGGESCPLLQFSNLVLTINCPHFLRGSPWFCFGSTLFFLYNVNVEFGV